MRSEKQSEVSDAKLKQKSDKYSAKSFKFFVSNYTKSVILPRMNYDCTQNYTFNFWMACMFLRMFLRNCSTSLQLRQEKTLRQQSKKYRMLPAFVSETR